MHSWLESRHGSACRQRWDVIMVLSEHELQILRSLEASLRDCERQCADIERRVRGRRQLWLTTLCLAAFITGIDLVILATIIESARTTLAVLGSVVLAGACWYAGVLAYRYLRERAAWREPPPGNVLDW